MEQTFSWFPRLTEVLAEVCRDFPEQAGAFALAVSRYGTYGEEPEFEELALRYAFMAVKNDIDCSLAARNKNKGGRPSKKTAGKTEVSEVSENGNGGYGGLKPSKPPLRNISQVKLGKEKEKTPKGVKKKETGKQSEDIPFDAIISRLNAKAGTAYRPKSDKTRSLIRARFAEGFTEADFAAVIDKQVERWAGDPEMSRFLRPETLFGTKFEGYLNAPPPKPKADNPMLGDYPIEAW